MITPKSKSATYKTEKYQSQCQQHYNKAGRAKIRHNHTHAESNGDSAFSGAAFSVAHIKTPPLFLYAIIRKESKSGYCKFYISLSRTKTSNAPFLTDISAVFFAQLLTPIGKPAITSASQRGYSAPLMVTPSDFS